MMCSIGHHDEPDTVRPPRRHLDDTWRRMVRATPAKTLAATRAEKTAQLRAELQASEADALAQAHGVQQFEIADSYPAAAMADAGRVQPYWARMP